MLAWEALCRPERTRFWSEGLFFDLRRPYVALKAPCATLRGSSFGIRGSLLAKMAYCRPESPVPLERLCQYELALNWPESFLCRPE